MTKMEAYDLLTMAIDNLSVANSCQASAECHHRLDVTIYSLYQLQNDIVKLQ
jgi:hypothetical protein